MNRRHALIAAAAACGYTPALRAATPGLDAPPVPGPAPLLRLPVPHETRLPNGMGLVLMPRQAVPLVCATVLLRAGPETDPSGHSGLASLAATLATQGARRQGRAVGAVELARQAERLGGSLAAASSTRATSFSITVPAPEIGAALALLADVVRQPLLAAADLQRERERAIDGLRLALGTPGGLAQLAARRAHTPGEELAATPTQASLQSIKKEHVLTFFKNYASPQVAHLVLTGSLSTAQAEALAVQHFGTWRGEPAPTLAALNTTVQAPPQLLLDMPDAGQSAVMLALPFGPLSPQERRVAQVANAVLGVGYTSRLNQVIRIRQGLSYDVRSELESQPEGSLWLAQAQTAHPNALKVLHHMREQLQALLQAPPSAEELASRKALLAGSYGRRLETVQGLAALAVAKLAQGRSPGELAQDLPALQAVSAEQVLAFAQAHLQPQRLRSVVVGATAEVLADPRAAMEDWEQRKATALDLGYRSLAKP